MEHIHNYESGESDLYTVGGASLDFNTQNLYDVATDPLRVISKGKLFNAGLQGSAYLGSVHNLQQNSVYSGRAVAKEYSAGIGPATFSAARFETPKNSSGPYGTTVGWSPPTGINLGVTSVTVYAHRVRDTWHSVVDFVKGE